ncbi:MAG: RpiB/LacA/LacB family sugar-phosphate isomerase, partial [Actinomycetota bacterium]|nr:RpiB/LacA/LacB family sugar-phosphate isomerase [Actinomycetota bacterium]
MATIAVGSDHAGYALKEQLAGELRDLGHEVLDLGAHSTDRVDYPDFGAAVGRAV